MMTDGEAQKKSKGQTKKDGKLMAKLRQSRWLMADSAAHHSSLCYFGIQNVLILSHRLLPVTGVTGPSRYRFTTSQRMWESQ